MASHSIVTHDTNRERKRKIKTSQRSWSDLPEDILRLVNWLLTPIHDIASIDKSPWVLNYCFSPHRTICSLSDPYRKLPYIIEEERGWDDERGWIPAGSLLFRATAYASRYGWVLFSEKIRQVVHSTLYHVRHYYVYNPLTKDIISLPRLELPQHDYHDEHFATFSSNPTSPGCLFVVPTLCNRGIYFFISTYSVGDKAWKTHKFICRYPCYFSFSTHDMASMEGSFNLYLTKLEVDRAPGCNIFRYDWLDGAWKKMESLEGGALFLGKPSFGVSGGEQTKMVANRVYYFSSHTSRPSFLVYGSAGMEEKSDKSDKSDKSVCSQTSQNKIYYESWPEKSKSLGESGSRMWMEPPSSMP
ncbi:hypothetical protein PVL29_009220 [Vitis rotundifolia]|uniref:DUF295 domain-containing protein n=1 Tax=Vitis rotundifolia TaxID=103349 RepID=A0AA38ZXV3_VITRO|nr:hypothetical protein PVL29_009220 [Vitis rotundifolia]